MGSTTRLLVTAAVSRGLYLALVAALNALLNDYDTSSRLLSEDCSADWPRRVAAAPRARPLVVWDAIYFHRISTCGYEFEQYHAFFPAYPGLVNTMRAAAGSLGTHGFMMTALVVNNAAFLASTFFVYRLSQRILGEQRLAATATLLFIFNPASIFHAAPYTEAMFGCATLAGLYLLYCCQAPLAAALPFALATGIRSNGILNAGFLLHAAGHASIASWRSSKVSAVLHALRGVLGSALVALPYVAFQYLGYLRYCEEPLAAGVQRPWCAGRLPNLYGFVQERYWGVGLFKYFTITQVPNFLLAAPTLLLSLWGIYSYAATKPRTFWTGGLLPPVPTPQPPPSILGIGYTPLRRQQKEAARRKSESGAQSTPSQSPSRGNGTLVHRAAGAAADAATGTAGGRTRSPQPGGTQRAPSPGLFPAQPARSSRAQAPAAAASALMQRPHTPLPGRSSGSSSNGLMLSSCGGGFYSPDVAVFIYQWAFMVLFAALVMHVQVATRFLSTLLPWYWWAAQLLLQRKGVAPWLWGYCFGYMALGAVLFPNFLPWT